jgi:hypothetical protein
MTTNWIVNRAGVEKGPFTSAQLKSFAAKGKLKPDDKVRKTSGENFYCASQVTGLFPDQTPATDDDFEELTLAPVEEAPASERSEERAPFISGPSQEVRTIAMLIYLLAIVSGFVGPLILWLIKRDESKFIDDHGRNVLNLTITLFIVSLCLIPVSLATFALPGIVRLTISLAIFPLSSLLSIGAMIMLVIGAMEANKGARYEFPYCIKFF